LHDQITVGPYSYSVKRDLYVPKRDLHTHKRDQYIALRAINCRAQMIAHRAPKIDVFLDGYCSTVQGLLDWFEVDLGFTKVKSTLFMMDHRAPLSLLCL